MTVLLRSNKINIVLFYVGMIFAFIYQTLETLVLFFVPRWLYNKQKDITGKKVLITGAGNGVGQQLAVEFSKHGTCLLLVDINKQSLLQTKQLLHYRSTAFLYECDVSDYNKVYEMAEKVKKDAGHVDILVNNAGILSGIYLLDISEDKILKTIEVNTLAHFWTVKAFLPGMKERNSGHVVSIASLLGKIGATHAVDYCASKYAAIGFAESLEVELREQKFDGIKVTIVCPAHIDTRLIRGFKFNIGQIMSPAYVAKEVVLGVLQEREVVYLPYFCRFIPICKECVPRWIIIKFMEISRNMNVKINATVEQSEQSKAAFQD